MYWLRGKELVLLVLGWSHMFDGGVARLFSRRTLAEGYALFDQSQGSRCNPRTVRADGFDGSDFGSIALRHWGHTAYGIIT